MHDEFIEPTKQFADIIIPNYGGEKRAVDMVRQYIIGCLSTKDSERNRQ